MISVTTPRIYFQNQSVAEEFNQKGFLNAVAKWHQLVIKDDRKTINILPNAVYSNWSSTIQHEGKLFTPSLYLAPKAKEEVLKEFKKEPRHRLANAIVSCNNGSTNNYYHWTVQTLPSLINSRKYLDSHYTLILPEKLSNYQLEWLSLAKLDKHNCNHLYAKKRDIIFSNELIVPLTLYKPFDYQPSRSSLWQLREQILKNINTNEDLDPLPTKLYISRSDSKKARGLKNEEKLEQALKKIGFYIVRASSLSVKDQVKLFCNAQTIVAPHGAGLSNLIFANPQCRFIEINQSNYFNPCFSALHSIMGFSGAYSHYIAPIALNEKISEDMKHAQKTRVNKAKLMELIMG